MGKQLEKFKKRLKETHKYMWIYDFEYLLDIEYGALNSFLSKSKITIKKNEEELKKKMNEWNSKRKGHENLTDSFEMFETEIIEIGQFSSLLFNSFFIMSYSIFEHHFFEVSNYCQKEEEKNISVKEMKGNGIEKCKIFIKKEIGIDLRSVETHWEIITKYQKIRNSITHNYGILNQKDAKNKSLKEFILNNQYIDYDSKSRTVSINSIIFITEFTDLIKEYFSKLYYEVISQKKQ